MKQNIIELTELGMIMAIYLILGATALWIWYNTVVFLFLMGYYFVTVTLF